MSAWSVGVAAAAATAGAAVGAFVARYNARWSERIANRTFVIRWDEKRWDVCAEYLVHASLARRRLLNAGLARVGQPFPLAAAGQPQEQVELHETAVSLYNRIRLISDSDEVKYAANEMLVNLEQWILLLRRREISGDAVQELRDAYDKARKPFLDAVKKETGVALVPSRRLKQLSTP